MNHAASDILAKLRRHEPMLRAAGISHAALFGSHARGTAAPGSDIDIIVTFDGSFEKTGFARFGHLDHLRVELEALLGSPVDLLAEPVTNPRLEQAIGEERLDAF